MPCRTTAVAGDGAKRYITRRRYSDSTRLVMHIRMALSRQTMKSLLGDIITRGIYEAIVAITRPVSTMAFRNSQARVDDGLRVRVDEYTGTY